MIPYYPENTKQLQQQGLLDLGMRLLQASGPQQQGTGFGARVGQAGVGNLQAMRGAGQQMQQMQMLQEKQKQTQAMQNMRTGAANRMQQGAMNQGPLSAQQNTALDMGMAAILGGKDVPDFTTDTLYPSSDEQKGQSPLGKLNMDVRNNIITNDQYAAEIKDRYKASGSVSVYEKKLKDLTDLKVPRNVAVKVLSGMYRQVSDPIQGTVVIDMQTNQPIGSIKIGEGWVPTKNTDPFGIR